MEAIKAFLKNHYTDERLAALLAHAQDGKLVYGSCCCLMGAATADHALRGTAYDFMEQDHYLKARELPGGREAANVYYGWGDNGTRRAKLIPLILEEMTRREQLRVASTDKNVIPVDRVLATQIQP